MEDETSTRKGKYEYVVLSIGFQMTRFISTLPPFRQTKLKKLNLLTLHHFRVKRLKVCFDWWPECCWFAFWQCLRDDNGNAIPQLKLLECRMAVWLKWHPSFSEVTLFYTHKINGMIICQMSPFKIYVLLQKSIHNFLWTSISLGDIKINCA